MKILVTGFDPFGGESVNPAWEAVSRLPETINGAEVVRMLIPTSFERAPQAILEKVREYHPDYVISVGQAAGRTAITPERIAINMMSASIPDNDGEQPIEQKIEDNGPDGYFERGGANMNKFYKLLVLFSNAAEWSRPNLKKRVNESLIDEALQLKYIKISRINDIGEPIYIITKRGKEEYNN